VHAWDGPARHYVRFPFDPLVFGYRHRQDDAFELRGRGTAATANAAGMTRIAPPRFLRCSSREDTFLLPRAPVTATIMCFSCVVQTNRLLISEAADSLDSLDETKRTYSRLRMNSCRLF